MRQLGHMGTQIQTVFNELDGEGNSVQEFPFQLAIRQLTPLRFIELYEQLHAKRNALRVQVGLPETPMADVGFVLLEFLRELEGRGEPAPLPRLADLFRQVVERRAGDQEDRLMALVDKSREREG